MARLFRLKSGRYKVSLRSDRDGNGAYETVVSENEQELERFGRLTLSVPPKMPVSLEVTKLKIDPDPGGLPDLAISQDFVRMQGNSLVVTVYNIGTVPSGRFTVTVLCPRNNELKTVEAESLPGSADFVPKNVEVIIADLPDHHSYQISVDRENRIREIFEENNNAVIVTGNF